MRYAALFILVLAVNARLSAQDGWKSVTSKEGQFTVEMPDGSTANETRTRQGRGGKIRIISTVCATKNGLYIAMRADFPMAVARGTEDAYLDDQRDSLAEDWNGKVISEKKVNAGNNMGRDFAVRGKPSNEDGQLTIRVREYLVGKSIYIVLVVSPPNKELPVDAGRFLGSLGIGEKGARAAGKPEPEPTGTKLPPWGLAIDPDKDCLIKSEGKTLTITAPGKQHDLHPETGKLNAPRVLREIEGDFSFTVKVTGDFKPAGPSTNPRGIPYNGAGILIWSDSDNFIRLERAAVFSGNNVGTYVAFEEREGGYRGAYHNEGSGGGTCFLRVDRKGSRISGAISFDGTKWKELKPIDTVWPAKLKVGLSAINTSSKPFEVKFEDLSGK